MVHGHQGLLHRHHLSVGEFKISFLSIPRIVVDGGCYYSHFLFAYFFLGLSLFVCCCFVLFLFFLGFFHKKNGHTKTFCAIRKHWFAVFIFILIKKQKTIFFSLLSKPIHFRDKSGNNKKYLLLAFLIDFIITSLLLLLLLLLLSLSLLLLLLLLILLVYITRSSGRA